MGLAPAAGTGSELRFHGKIAGSPIEVGNGFVRGREAHDGAWTLMDLGLLAALLGAFENRDPSLIVGACFEENEHSILCVPSGIGAEIRFHGRIVGSSIGGGSGFIRTRNARAEPMVRGRSNSQRDANPSGQRALKPGAR